ncbi:MAG TPA: cytochrome c oxidase subunit 3 [Candidatus Eisenbacteria bacterium]|nr:cytochrome c oxidase subunit 3 [Candidatus Eisenbacteria bacterium]
MTMARSSAARRLDDAAPAIERRRPGFGGGDLPPVVPNRAVVSNASLAVAMFIAAEVMFFAGLIGAFLVFRLGSPVWPPPFQPRLPLGVTGVNTLVLLLSAVTMDASVRRMRAGAVREALRALSLTAILGGAFLLIQGYEWFRLIHFGLTVSSSVYGGLFYTLIGFHAAHVLGALVWLFAVLAHAKRGKLSKTRHASLATCRMYWTFVVALWPVLYVLVYLN